jgi:transposase-like protein
VTPERTNRRNAYRSRQLDTRVGSIDLSIPKLREGSYYPGWLLEPRRRAERALVAVVAECYVRGVSKRRVEGLVQTLGIEQLSKSQVRRMAKELDVEVTAFRSRPLDGGPYTYLSLDAMTQKVRESGRIVNIAVVIAVGVNADGHREVLGFDVITLVRTIFAQPDAASVWDQHARVVEQLTERFPTAAELLAEAAPDVLAFTAFPREHWKQIWSNNPQERPTRNSAGAPTSWGSPPTATPSSDSSVPCSPSNATSGRSCAAT